MRYPISISQDSCRKASFKHICQILESDQPPELKWQIAQWIQEEYTILDLREEQDIVQLAISVICVCDPNVLKNPKNPYRMLKDIKQIISSEEPFAIEIKSEEIAGESVHWNLQTLRQQGLWNGFRAIDLPKEITQNTIKDVFDALEKRLDNLDSKLREDTKTYILNSCGQPISELKGNLQKKYIPGLLEKPDSENALVSSSQFYLCSSLKAVLDADDCVQEGGLLSKREEMLLKLSASVQNCSTGQRDGLANYYNVLPSQYKQGPKASENGEEEGIRFVDNCVQKIMNETFVSEKFIVSLVGYTIPHVSHITEYLKNRFHKQGYG